MIISERVARLREVANIGQPSAAEEQLKLGSDKRPEPGSPWPQSPFSDWDQWTKWDNFDNRRD